MNRLADKPPLAIEAKILSKRFKKCVATDNLNWTVESGGICALLGPNGAGKSTTMKLLIGALRPTTGTSRLLGEGSMELQPETLRKIGYVAEGQDLPDKMTLGQLARFLKPSYPSWDDAFFEDLRSRFDLPLDRKLRDFSRGMRMQAKLLSVLAYHPELLLLDEPFAGLDPVACEASADAILDWSQEGNGQKTAIISSHEIEDVERLADRIVIIRSGQLVLDEEADQLKERVKKVSVELSKETDVPARWPENWLGTRQAARIVTYCDTDYSSERSEALARSLFKGVVRIGVETMTLRAIYIACANSTSCER